MNSRKLVNICIISACLIAMLSVKGISETNSSNRKTSYGDTLIIKIPAEPSMGGVFSIPENGSLTLIPVNGIDIGQINVVGMTIPQIEAELSRRLSEYYVNTDVTINISSSSSYVSAYGKIMKPGTTLYRENLKLLDLLISAGGLTPDAEMTSISIYRESESAPINIDVTELLTGASSENNISLFPGDYVIVPPLRADTKIKVITLGQVKSTGSVYVPKGSRLIDVFAEAGGSTGRAGLGKAYIIRMVNSQPQVIHCDLKSLISKADMSQNVEVKDGDIMFIPESDGVDVMKVVNDIVDINLLKNTLEKEF